MSTIFTNQRSQGQPCASEFYDPFDTTSAELNGRVSPTGQVWAIQSAVTGKAEVTSGYMQLKSGQEGTTLYPTITLTSPVRNMGAEVEWISLGGATNYGSIVLIIAASAGDLSALPFLHCTCNPGGEYKLEWYATGLNGGVTNVTTLNGVASNSVRYTLQVTIDSNGTVTDRPVAAHRPLAASDEIGVLRVHLGHRDRPHLESAVSHRLGQLTQHDFAGDLGPALLRHS